MRALLVPPHGLEKTWLRRRGWSSEGAEELCQSEDTRCRAAFPLCRSCQPATGSRHRPSGRHSVPCPEGWQGLGHRSPLEEASWELLPQRREKPGVSRLRLAEMNRPRRARRAPGPAGGSLPTPAWPTGPCLGCCSGGGRSWGGARCSGTEPGAPRAPLPAVTRPRSQAPPGWGAAPAPLLGVWSLRLGTHTSRSSAPGEVWSSRRAPRSRASPSSAHTLVFLPARQSTRLAQLCSPEECE